MTENGHILIVDDQQEICDVVQEYLTGEGYRVSTAHDGLGMRRTLAQGHVDLVILDLMLPGEDGLTLARSLRSESGIGIIILTGRGEEVDRIVGLEMGADDYLPKPFHPRELLARIRSILARSGGAEIPVPADSYRFGGRRLDTIRRIVEQPDGRAVPLSGAEFQLLSIFVARPNRVLSRDLLVELTQGREAPAYDRSIDVRVSRLRQVLEDKDDPKLLQTVYGE